MNNTTIEYFNEKAVEYFNDTVTMSARDNQDWFSSYLKPGAHILDFGCGSGRDSAFFRDKGFVVTPTDGSKKMCELAEQYLKMPVKVLEFNDLDDVDEYDGIYASASIMHLEYDKLLEVFPKMIRALKDNGILYMSFKYGNEDGYLDKRYYTYMNEGKLVQTLAKFPELTIERIGVFGSEKDDFRWIHVVCRKVHHENHVKSLNS